MEMNTLKGCLLQVVILNVFGNQAQIKKSGMILNQMMNSQQMTQLLQLALLYLEFCFTCSCLLSVRMCSKHPPETLINFLAVITGHALCVASKNPSNARFPIIHMNIDVTLAMNTNEEKNTNLYQEKYMFTLAYYNH